MPQRKNILVIRNDKIGDFMLSWPALSLLKNQYPDCTITMLVPPYTQPLAELCPWIDNIILDDQHRSAISDAFYLKSFFRAGNFDTVITLYSEFRTGLAVYLSAINQRVAPATKIAQLFYNRTLRQRRSLSEKPEYEYNIDLVKHYIRINGGTPTNTQGPPYLKFKKETLTTIRHRFFNDNKVSPNHQLVFLHPGSGGSANNLSISQYADLARQISSHGELHLVITCGPDELAVAQHLSKLLGSVQHSIYHSTKGLVEFSKQIAIADLFISGSTGPLHIAGALDIATLSFYPTRISATALRWQTTNSAEKRISLTLDSTQEKSQKAVINLHKPADMVIDYLARRPDR